MTVASALYLPKTANDLFAKVLDQSRHPGLKLDKLSWAKDQKEQIEAIGAVCACNGDNALLKALFERRSAILDALGAWQFQGWTAGSLTLHLARTNALENAGLALHPIYGFAWLPGTGLKGMTRAWAETVWKPSETDQQAAEDRIKAAFGTPNVAGRIIFHDAWPIRWPQLESDIVNSHHSKYYKEGAEKKPPGDREVPVPVYFLTVASNTKFEFALSDRSGVRDGLLEQAVAWMCAALEHAGVGAKTAAGYGRIVPRAPDSPDHLVPVLPGNYLRHEHSLTLASPAFLAGAKQEQVDCDLRPASLRGLLRWWWRTMHANHLSTEDLARLEALIWGDTKRGGAVSLSIRAAEKNASSAPYKKESLKQASSLPKPKDKKSVQGLFYASYGMDERNSRWYRQSGDSWDITLTSRETCWVPNPENDRSEMKIPAALVMRQVEAALWLLTRFGSVGSKARKGFGSFVDVSVERIDSLEACIEVGWELRTTCGFEAQDGHGAGSPALERRIGPVEIKTPWRDPWFALDRVGAVYQSFIKRLKQTDREVLGLPRGKNSNRLASPAHWSLTRGDDKCLIVRLIAVFERRPTDNETSRKVLEHLSEFTINELKKEISQHNKGGLRPPPLKPSEPARSLKSGQEIQAELLEKKTKKGGWMAKDIHTGIEGNIQNSEAVTPDVTIGQQVRLIVKIANPNNTAFQWPTSQIEEQVNRSATRNRQRGKKRR